MNLSLDLLFWYKPDDNHDQQLKQYCDWAWPILCVCEIECLTDIITVFSKNICMYSTMTMTHVYKNKIVQFTILHIIG